jgi:hypothetical protein
MLHRAAAVAACAITNVAYTQTPGRRFGREAATVSQTVDGTTFTVSYSRPRLRGRTEIFGRLERAHCGRAARNAEQ